MESYGWVTDPDVTSYAVAGCLTLVAGLDEGEALARVGAEPSSALSTTGDGHDWISASGVEGESGTVLIEDNGWYCSRPEVLVALGRQGPAASVFWNVEGLVRFACARRGKIVADVDLEDPLAAVDELPRALRPIARRGEADLDPVAVGVALAAKFTGLRPEPGPGVTRPARRAPVTSPLFGLLLSKNELLATEWLPGLPARVQQTQPPARRRLAHWAAAEALAKAGLTDAPEVQGVRRQLDGPGAVTLPPAVASFRARAGREYRALELELSTNGLEADDPQQLADLARLSARYWAMEALAYTATGDDVQAALGACYCVYVLSEPEGHAFLASATARLDG